MTLFQRFVIFSFLFVIESVSYGVTTLYDVLNTINSKCPVEEKFTKINDFISENDQPLDLKGISIYDFVLGIGNLIDYAISNLDTKRGFESIILIYDFVSVFPRNHDGSNILLEQLIRKINIFLGLSDDSELGIYIKNLLIHKRFLDLNSIFTIFLNSDFSAIDEDILNKITNLLLVFICAVSRSYRHYHKETFHDKIQPISFICDVLVNFEQEHKPSDNVSNLLLKIKEYLSLVLNEVLLSNTELASASFVKQVSNYLGKGDIIRSSNTCGTCNLPICFGHGILTYSSGPQHEVCWFLYLAQMS